MLTQIPTQILGIICGVFITRMLGPEGRGVYAIFYADIALFSTILGFSINTAITHFKASNFFPEKTLISVSILFSIVTILLSFALLIIWLNLPIADLLFPSEHISWTYLLLFSIFIILGQFNTLYAAFFQGARKFDVVNKVLLLNSIYNLIIFGIAFIMHHYMLLSIGVTQVLFMAGLVLLLNAFQWHVHYRKHFTYQINLRVKWQTEIKPFFAFMGLGHLSSVINFFNYRLVLWVLAYYLDHQQIGIFSLGAGLAQLIDFISIPLAQVLMPYLSAETAENRWPMFVKYARLHFSIVLVLGALSVLIAVPLIPVLYGVAFAQSAHVFYMIVGGVILATQTRQIAVFFISSGKIRLNLYATITGFLLTFGFNIWLVRDYGIYGGAIAQTITYSGIFLFVYLALINFTKCNTLNIFFVNRADIEYAKQRLKQKTRRD